MDWIAVGLVVGFLLIAGLAVYKVAQSPTFWLGMITAVSSSVYPVFVAIITKAEKPEDRVRRLEVERRGGTWDYFRKREKVK